MRLPPLDSSDVFILGGMALALVGVGLIFGGAVSLSLAGVLLSGWGLVLHMSKRGR